MATKISITLEAAIDYADRGWRVIPLIPSTKRPPMKEWQKKATTDNDIIIQWWERWPDSDVGVAMGRSSGIIDVECDTAEGEELLLKIFGGQPPMTPTFISGSGRGKHRLYKYRSDLPAKANKNWNGIDFKLGVDDLGSQSVFPPSSHKSGGTYLWCPGLSPDEIDVADLPDSVVAFLWNICEGDGAEGGRGGKTPAEWEEILGGAGEGARHPNALTIIGKVLGQWANLENPASVQIAFDLIKAANARNKPPLDEAELKSAFVDILKKERRQRASEDFGNETTPTPEQSVAGVVSKDRDFKLIIVESEPPIFELFSDRFSYSPGSCIILNAEQLISGRAIRLESLKQAHFALPGSFSKAWERKGGLYEQLVATADRREASPDRRRTSIVAQRILDELERAKAANEADEPDPRGRATKMQNGDVVFAFNSIWDEIRFSADKITRDEVASALERAGVSDFRPRAGGSRKRLRRGEPRAIECLRTMAATGATPIPKPILPAEPQKTTQTV